MSRKQAKYIVAVSGGLDSVVLLDMLVRQRLPSYQLPTTNYQLIVAHFDHGIREESTNDAAFVKELAKKYELPFELGEGNLGTATSEHTSREARYKYLQHCFKKYKALGIIAAHHQDDLIETMVLNLLRGTGWRGLISLQSNPELLRPLLDTPKQSLYDYAEKRRLRWNEDISNSDQTYLRNYIRHTIMLTVAAKDTGARHKLVAINKKLQTLESKIATELQNIIPQIQRNICQLNRYQAIMWPTSVADEVIYQVLTRLDPAWHPTKLQILRVLHFIKAGWPQKQLQVSKNLNVRLTVREALFQKH